MLLGKRPRPPMRRTTSLSEITFDVGDDGGAEAVQSAVNTPPPRHQKPPQAPYYWQEQQEPSNWLDSRYTAAVVSPRNPRRNSGDFAAELALYLRTCGLCKRRLGPGKDTFMYRGEIAFCSLECRQQQIAIDARRERKERCSLASRKKDAAEVPQGAAGTEAAAAAAASEGETIVAA